MTGLKFSSDCRHLISVSGDRYESLLLVRCPSGVPHLPVFVLQLYLRVAPESGAHHQDETETLRVATCELQFPQCIWAQGQQAQVTVQTQHLDDFLCKYQFLWFEPVPDAVIVWCFHSEGSLPRLVTLSSDSDKEEEEEEPSPYMVAAGSAPRPGLGDCG